MGNTRKIEVKGISGPRTGWSSCSGVNETRFDYDTAIRYRDAKVAELESRGMRVTEVIVQHRGVGYMHSPLDYGWAVEVSYELGPDELDWQRGIQ